MAIRKWKDEMPELSTVIAETGAITHIFLLSILMETGIS